MLDKQSGSALSRRDFVALGVGVFVVASVPLARARRQRVIRRTMPVMGTIAEFAVVHRDPRQAHLAIDAAMAELTRVESVMTRFKVSSEVGRANVQASSRAVRIGDETALVVGSALRWADYTDGAYDPALGSAVAMWDVLHRREPPPAADISRYRGRQLYRKVEIGTSGGSSVILYHDADVSIDLGSIAKGYAVDKAVAVLRNHGIRHAIVCAGGDLYCLGNAVDGQPWRVGIQDPKNEHGTIGTVDVTDAAIATSGTYVRHFVYHGHNYHHLLDPSTGAPRETAVQGFTVQSENCMHADVASTAAFGLSDEKANALFARCAPGTRVVRIV